MTRSSWCCVAAALLLYSLSFLSKQSCRAQVYIVGEVGICEELDLKGIQHIGGPQDADKKIELSPGFALEHDESVSA